MNTIIAYAYDGDIHCPDCTEKHFGIEEYPFDTCLDSEGNAPVPGYDGDNEYAHGCSCVDCGEELYEPTCEGCVDCLPIIADYPDHTIVNPSDGLGRYPHRAWQFQFGQIDIFSPTRLLVWADHFEEAFEIAAEWLADNKPGMFTDPNEMKRLYDEALAELVKTGADPEDEDTIDRAHTNAEADLTYTESGYLTSWEWTGGEA